MKNKIKNAMKKIVDVIIGTLIYVYVYLIVPVFQNRVVAKVCGVMGVLGIVFALGTAGASDLGNISEKQMTVQMIVSVVMVWLGIFAFVCRSHVVEEQ